METDALIQVNVESDEEGNIRLSLPNGEPESFTTGSAFLLGCYLRGMNDEAFVDATIEYLNDHKILKEEVIN